MKTKISFLSLIFIIALFFNSCINNATDYSVTLDSLPEFSDKAYVVINSNEPYFIQEDLVTESYESYSNLDYLGRCGVAMACVGVDIMPTEERGSIGQVKPSGWQTVKYDIVEGKYLYNRCHLIGFQLTGENANECNLITGTRYLNVEGMLPFENLIADYVKETDNHVIYRVTPIYDGDNLLASGVQMEGKSVEDDGAGVCFNVYAYNNQPGILIDYATGESQLDYAYNISTTDAENNSSVVYVLNKSSKKFHLKNCSSVKDISEYNKEFYYESRANLISDGYSPCKNCNP